MASRGPEKMKVKCYSYVYSSNGRMKQLKNSQDYTDSFAGVELEFF